jgi:uncharacterized protein (TIGR02391 family)
MINKELMRELRERLNITTAAIYFKIQSVQKECLCTKEAAAYLLAADVGIPIYNMLSEPDLKQLRDLQKARAALPKRSPIVVRKEAETKDEVVEDKPITPNRLFDLLSFHPRIVKASKSQFKSGHYADAIFNAFRCIEVFAKEKSGLTGSGADLMHRIFNQNKPVIKLNKMQNEVEIDEQAGFRFIYAGAMVGIRNPKAHSEIPQTDPYRTLEYLALASLLAKRLDEGIKADGADKKE